MTLTPAFIARFWSRIVKHPDVPGQPTACWEWQGGRATSMRYGIVALGYTPERKKIVDYAHRIAWILVHGPVPEGQCVLHHCDNPICCRDEHHFLGSRTDNSRDMVSKRRHVHGAEHPAAKLTEAEVVEARTAFATGLFTVAALATEYGVHVTGMGRLLTGKAWARVGGPLRPARGTAAEVATGPVVSDGRAAA